MLIFDQTTMPSPHLPLNPIGLVERDTEVGDLALDDLRDWFGRLRHLYGHGNSPEIVIDNNDPATVQNIKIFGNYLRSFPRELFPGLRTFAVDGKNLYVLDSCRIVVVDEGGVIRSEFGLTAAEGAPRCGEVVDFQVNRGKLYLLTVNSLWIGPLPRQEE